MLISSTSATIEHSGTIVNFSQSQSHLQNHRVLCAFRLWLNTIYFSLPFHRLKKERRRRRVEYMHSGRQRLGCCCWWKRRRRNVSERGKKEKQAWKVKYLFCGCWIFRSLLSFHIANEYIVNITVIVNVARMSDKRQASAASVAKRWKRRWKCIANCCLRNVRIGWVKKVKMSLSACDSRMGMSLSTDTVVMACLNK